MEINVYRHTYNVKDDRNIIGDLFINGEFFCYTLEDEKRADGVKVYGETAIPTGTYNVLLTKSNRFKRLMPLIVDVPMFRGIRIHGGNTSKDTLGCILVAFNTDYKKIWGTAEKFLTKELKEGENITITIEDRCLTYDKEKKQLL
tara:strand:- start:952 stop:1386 length:435 start_codon:yes stop_codon:yes gene_type:complete